jgi:hypothetical protein
MAGIEGYDIGALSDMRFLQHFAGSGNPSHRASQKQQSAFFRDYEFVAALPGVPHQS